MEPVVEFTVEKIHSTATKLVLFAVSWLLTVPGASRTVLEVRVPYSPVSLGEVLGYCPKAYANAETAAALARAAFRHAADLSPFGTDVVGVGCTCALATDREKRGEHKAFVATCSSSGTRTYAVRLAKGARSRQQEDGVASRLLLRAVADATGVGGGALDLGLLPAAAAAAAADRGADGSAHVLEELAVETQAFDPSTALQDLINGRVSTVEFSGGNVYVDAPRKGRIYLPGSFNPLHDGHRELLEAACRVKPGMEGCFELSIGNADKGLLPISEIQQRVAQFTAAGLPLVAPLFTQKAELFHDSVFVVGYDTVIRLVDSKYYGDSNAMLLQFARLRNEGCSFLVAGRVRDGRFLTLADMDMPAVLPQGGLFEEIPEIEFRADISSTELRASGVTAATASTPPRRMHP
eukprot:scaffold20.g7845.t1